MTPPQATRRDVQERRADVGAAVLLTLMLVIGVVILLVKG
jgi:hypothetical protein